MKSPASLMATKGVILIIVLDEEGEEGVIERQNENKGQGSCENVLNGNAVGEGSRVTSRMSRALTADRLHDDNTDAALCV